MYPASCRMRAFPALAATTCLLLLLITAAQAQEYPGWQTTWINNMKGGKLSQQIEIFPINQWWNPRQTAEEDGGYTYNILLKYTPGAKIYRLNYTTLKITKTNYSWKDVLFVSQVVKTWNAAIQYTAEHYDWGKHLSKLRLKLYIEGINQTIPEPDIVIDPTIPGYEACGGAVACAKSARPTQPFILIPGLLDSLSHELGHAIGLGHNTGYPNNYEIRRDWRGFEIGGRYPAGGWRPYPVYGPPDTFVMYALALRFSSLRDASPGDVLRFDGGWLSPPSNLTILSRPGEVWTYHYTVIDEGDKRIRVYYPVSPLSVTVGAYGETLCINPLRTETGELPFVADYGNGTRLALYSYDLQRAILERELERNIRSGYTALVPKKLLNMVLPYINQSNILRILVYDGIGPGWDNVTGVSMRGRQLCLENLRDRLLVELKLGRAYRLETGPVRAEAVSGWAYVEDGKVWALRKSVVKLSPMYESYQLSENVRLVWRGGDAVNISADRPMNLLDRLWKKQYLVRVKGLFSEVFKGAGWLDAGSTASIHPEKEFIDLGNGTRLVFKGFKELDGTDVRVEKPLTLTPVWEKEYRVETLSRYMASGEKFFKANETLFTVMPLTHSFPNGTTVELMNLTAVGLDGRVIAKWTPPTGDMALIRFNLTQPVTIKIDWNVYQLVRVESVLESFEENVQHGSVIDIGQRLRQSVELGNATRLVIKNIYVNGERHKGLQIIVDKPLNVSVEYARQYLVSMAVEAGAGYLAEPGHVILSRGDETAVYTPPASYVEEGPWQSVSITYRGEEVNVAQQLVINGPGEYRLKSGLRAVKVRVVDVLGIPAPFAHAWIYPDTATSTALDGSATLPAVPPSPVSLRASSLLGGGEAMVPADATTATVVIPLSTWTLALIAAACLAAVSALKRLGRWPQRQPRSS